jgi:hypothetical protein
LGIPQVLDLATSFFALLPELVVEVLKGIIREPSPDWRVSNVSCYSSFLFLGVKADHAETGFYERRGVLGL